MFEIMIGSVVFAYFVTGVVVHSIGIFEYIVYRLSEDMPEEPMRTIVAVPEGHP